MAQNFKACGDVLDVTASGTITAGDGVLVGETFGVAAGSAVSGGEYRLMVEGVFTLPKRTHASTAAIGQGDAVYWNTSTKKIDNTSNGGVNKLVGFAYNAAVSTAATVDVNLESIPSAKPAAANVAAISTANGSDAATTLALANATKTTVNAILVALKGAGLMTAD